jgi:hypothetical protein
MNVFIVMGVVKGGKHIRYCRDNFPTLGDALDWIDDNEEESWDDGAELYVTELSQ